MKHKLLLAAAATALLGLPALASAQDANDAEGFYVRGQLGYGSHNDMDLTSNDIGIMGDVESEGNIAYSLGAGYDFGDWRFELDGTSLFTELGAISQAPNTRATLRTENIFLNAIYDFSDFGRWSPYVGAGIGLIDTDGSFSSTDFLNNSFAAAMPGDFVTATDGTRTAVGLTRNPTCMGPRPTFNAAFSCDSTDTGSTFGYQLLAGLGYDITDNLTWDTSYRYFDGGDVDVKGVIRNTVAGNSAASQTSLEDVGGHVLLTGFRYRFGDTPAAPAVVAPVAPVADFACWDGSMVFNAGQCPPEPVVVPDPTVSCWDGTLVYEASECPVQPETFTCPDGTLTYDLNTCQGTGGVVLGDICGEQYRQEIIYYEFDRGQSAETRNTINRILDAGQYCDVASIAVVGHTDTSGAASYNLALSKRRAKDAVDELVRQGVRREVISSDGKGESEPFIDTGDGVKEQLNRRTEVLITLNSVGAGVFN